MDDRIIDFNDLKNKAKDKDVDKFEQYTYNLYYSVAQGQLSISDFSKAILKYMEENNISQEKLFNIQSKLMERYGLDLNSLESQMKTLGIDLKSIGLNQNLESYENVRKTMSFNEKYKDRISIKNVTTYYIKNDTNSLDIIIDRENILLKSATKIDLKDVELNEFLCSYKKVIDNGRIKITICENANSYEY
ncbi:hypothetical protein CPJCM30710_28690 [Clostridium polyendosporum]|uniref:DUF3867 domain-containing protein n=1 Tax=Clostridium polyendosporum TaxID=69208 RepID=A0A919S404_9CLOT|nr:DUF3867 domain-containing protein [Clostridium polyendosporum]GIM30203.1 hypothetical protein CPJCM30710_28690 [Clostridium polyendosporum]